MCRLVTGHKATALQEVSAYLHLVYSGFLVCLFVCRCGANKGCVWFKTDLSGVSAVPAISSSVLQPRCSAPYSISKFDRTSSGFNVSAEMNRTGFEGCLF